VKDENRKIGGDEGVNEKLSVEMSWGSVLSG
jgi:hypothetical protein